MDTHLPQRCWPSLGDAPEPAVHAVPEFKVYLAHYYTTTVALTTMKTSIISTYHYYPPERGTGPDPARVALVILKDGVEAYGGCGMRLWK